MSQDAPWDSDSFGVLTCRPSQLRHLATQAARWGADQELEACCEWLDIPNNRSDRGDGWLMPGRLRAARRPKPSSLKEQALDELHVSFGQGYLKKEATDAIRRALEALPD